MALSIDIVQREAAFSVIVEVIERVQSTMYRKDVRSKIHYGDAIDARNSW